MSAYAPISPCFSPPQPNNSRFVAKYFLAYCPPFRNVSSTNFEVGLKCFLPLLNYLIVQFSDLETRKEEEKLGV
jgi:hypothetical protein